MIRKGLVIGLAGVVLLALIELHDAIVRQGLRFVGAGTTSPTVLAVMDGCGNDFWVPLALRGLSKSKDPWPLKTDCDAQARVMALLPREQSGVLFVNGTPLQPIFSAGRAAWFQGLKLQRGANQLTVVDSGQDLLYPFPVMREQDLPGFLLAASLAGRDGGADLATMSSWTSPASAQSVLLWVGDGDAVGDTAAPPRPRTLSLVRRSSGEVNVRAEACLPAAHPLAARARDARLSGPEFVATAFQAAVYATARAASDPSWRGTPMVTVDAVPADAPCVPLRALYEIPDGRVMLFAMDDFLVTDGDQLTLEGFTGLLTLMFRQPDRTTGGRMVWKGDPAGSVILMSRLPPAMDAAAKRGPPRPDASADDVLTRFAAQAASAPGIERQRLGLLKTLKDLSQSPQQALGATLWGLAAAAPVALILWALGQGPVVSPTPRRVRTKAALLALLAFMAAFAIQPVLLQTARVLLRGLPLATVDLGGNLSAPVALCVVLMILPILRGGAMPVRPGRYRLRTTVAALASIVLVVAALAVLTLGRYALVPDAAREMLEQIPPDCLPWDAAFVDRAPTPVALALIFGAWVALGLGLFWAAVYWFFRVAVPSAQVAGAAFVAGLLLFLLPLTQATAEAMALATATASAASGAAWGLFLPAMLSEPTRQVLAFTFSVGFALVVVVIALRAFREVAASMLDDRPAARLRRVTRAPLLVLAALVIVWPMFDRSMSNPGAIHSVVYRLMSVFLAFGSLLALLAPWAVAQEFDAAQRDAARAERFRLPDPLIVLLGATFAGYLTLWNREPVAAAILMVLGWLVFRHLVLGTQAPSATTRSGGAPATDSSTGEVSPTGLGQRLVDHLTESRLLRARRAALEKLFSEGKLSMSNLLTQRIELDKRQRRLDADLGMKAPEAKRALFDLGPGPSPLANGIRGAQAGIVVGVLMQLLLQFDLASGYGAGSATWTTLVSKFVIDPDFQVVTPDAQDSRVLAFVGELLNAISIWAITGFIFGYAFHRIRGTDGFMRAAVFGVAMAIPYTLSQALTSPSGGVPLATIARVVPLVVFLLLIGTLVFDGATLRRERIGLARLPDIYGLKTSVGYLSFAGVLASVQPLLEFLGWLMP